MKTSLITLTALFLGSSTFALAQFQDRQGPRGERPDPSKIAATLVAEFDLDGDNALTVDEFTTAVHAHRKMIRMQRQERKAEGKGNRSEQGRGQGRPRGPGKGDPETMQARLEEAFHQADLDGTGQLDETEVAGALEAIRPPRPQRGQRKH